MLSEAEIESTFAELARRVAEARNSPMHGIEDEQIALNRLLRERGIPTTVDERIALFERWIGRVRSELRVELLKAQANMGALDSERQAIIDERRS
ncbi:hypothetical protein [Bradyrhizobium sp. USDA 10063]